MQTVWISLVAFAAVLLELAAGLYGLPVPAVAVAVFYLAAVFGWRAAVFPALLAAAVPEILFGQFPVLPLLAVPGVMAMARFWRSEGNRRLLPLQAVPGAVCGLLQAAVLLPVESFGQERFFWRLLAHNLWLTLQMTAMGALLGPVFCHLLDRLAGRLGFGRYQTAHPASKAAGHAA